MPHYPIFRITKNPTPIARAHRVYLSVIEVQLVLRTPTYTMAKTLEKTRKQIAKKRNGTIQALHEKSRDSRRLHRAQVRDDRLEKIAEARRKKDQPLCSYSMNRLALRSEQRFADCEK